MGQRNHQLETRQAQVHQRFVEANQVREMVAQLKALLAGQTSRANVQAWARQQHQRGGFSWPEARSVHDSINNLDTPEGACVRDIDVRAYIRWLTDGDTFRAHSEELIGMVRDPEDLAKQLSTDLVRWWFEGVGWYRSLRFCSPINGLPFVAHSSTVWPHRVTILAHEGADRMKALLELFELLAIDEQDCGYIDPNIDVELLPGWLVVAGDGSQTRRFHCYAKAMAVAAGVLGARCVPEKSR